MALSYFFDAAYISKHNLKIVFNYYTLILFLTDNLSFSTYSRIKTLHKEQIDKRFQIGKECV